MNSKQSLFIGIMSGTSADGIDVAVVRMDGRPGLLHFSEQPMPPKLRPAILRLAEPGYSEIDNMGGLDRALGFAYAEAVQRALAEAGLDCSDIAAVGLHGQTIRHRPVTTYPFSLQIGCPATVAEQTGITVVSDFRSRDIAAGGQGAPLVPYAHRALFGSDQASVAVLNIGGIANITWLGADGSVTGFDTGPGNMLMDALIAEISDGALRYDSDGEQAASGQLCQPLLERLMTHPFINQAPPKSTGREDFGDAMVHQIMAWPEITDADRMATASHFTVETIAQSFRFLPEPPKRCLCCGGGVRNSHLLSLLKQRLAPCSVSATDAAGVPAQAVEAISFALLARATLIGAPNALASVTGADHDVCGGRITPGENWPTLLQTMPAWIR